MTNFLVRVTDDVVSASCGRNSEQKEAPRSTSEIRQYRVVGHRKSDRTRRVQVHLFFKIKKHLTFKLSAFNMVRVTSRGFACKSAMLVDPTLRVRYPTSHLSAKKQSTGLFFLTPKPS